MQPIPPVFGRSFTLRRDVDHTGVSGTGTVADGVEFPDGTVAVRWRGEHVSTVVWASLADALHVHGHGGATHVVWATTESNAAHAQRTADAEQRFEDLRAEVQRQQDIRDRQPAATTTLAADLRWAAARLRREQHPAVYQDAGRHAADGILRAADRLDEWAGAPAPTALPVWAQRCSCGGQGITHLAAEHHEPIGPVDVDPFAGRACDLCGDYVTGPCPTCTPTAMAVLARVRMIAPALDYEATAPGMHDAAREVLRDASRRIRTALGTLPQPTTTKD